MSSLLTNSIDNNDVHPRRLVRIVYLLLIFTTLNFKLLTNIEMNRSRPYSNMQLSRLLKTIK